VRWCDPLGGAAGAGDVPAMTRRRRMNVSSPRPAVTVRSCWSGQIRRLRRAAEPWRGAAGPLTDLLASYLLRHTTTSVGLHGEEHSIRVLLALTNSAGSRRGHAESGHPPAGPQRLSTLIDHITTAVPSADVFVATIIPLSNSGQESAVRIFNAAIPGIVRSKVNSGKHVHLVDMHSKLTTADLVDGIHPTAGGYDKMAATWYDALLSVSGGIGQPGGGTPTPTPPSTGAIRGVGSGHLTPQPLPRGRPSIPREAVIFARRSPRHS
jgi:hypothetical protein